MRFAHLVYSPVTQSPPLIFVPRPKSNGLRCTPPSNVSFISLTPLSPSPLFSSFRRLSTASTAFLRHHCQVLTGLFYDAKQHREAISAGQRSSRSRIWEGLEPVIEDWYFNPTVKGFKHSLKTNERTRKPLLRYLTAERIFLQKYTFLQCLHAFSSPEIIKFTDWSSFQTVRQH